MEKYSSYKDSGVKWLGEIPSHWEVVSIKKISNIILGKMLENAPDDQGFPYLCAKDVHFDGVSYDDLKKMLFSENEKKKYIVKKGDLLVVEGGAGGTCAIIDKDIDDVYIQNSLMIVRGFPNKVSNNYIFYALSSLVKRGYADSVCNKATILHFTKEKLESTNIALAPLCEQIKIINYLDTVTSQIDVAISQQKKMIELLNERKQIIINNAVTKGLDPNVKMKDSGVEWIGEIPEHWDFCKLKHLTSIISKGTTPSTIGRDILESGEIRFLKAENIVDNKVLKTPEFYIDELTQKMLKRSNLYAGDILFVIAGATIGKVAVLPKELTPANTNQAISFIRISNPENILYVFHVLQSNLTKKYIWQNAVQSAQPNISMEDLGNIRIPLPPSLEQKNIIKYIEKKMTPIDNAINAANKQISLLQERKQIIINEVVTGKVKVC